MKTGFLAMAACFMLTSASLQAQDTTYTRLFRLYIDDDFINLRGKGTDEAYSAGLNLSFFYNKQRTPHFFIDRWMPHAGSNAVNTFGWGITQLVYTPRDINKTPPDRNDYRYAGALFAVHSLQSFNPIKKYSFSSEVILGVMGPPSFAEQTQKFFHRVINYRLPKGWAYQLPADALVNINFTAEKMIAQYRRNIELSGGGRIAVGTMEDGLTVFAKIRAGIMNPCFNGFMAQHTTPRKKQRLQAYAFIKPGAELLGYYALIDGGVFNKSASYYDDKNTMAPNNQKLIGHIDGGLTISSGKIALSVTEKIATSMLKDVRAHAIGNISLYVAW